MTACRDRTLSSDEQALKADAKALVRAAGGVEAASEVTGRSKTQLSAYGHPNMPDFMPVDVIAKLEAVTHGTSDHPILTRTLARRAGYALLKLPEAPIGADELHAALGSICKEHGDVVQRLCSLLQGGLTAAKVRELNLVGEIQDAMEAFAQLQVMVCEVEA